MLASHHNGATPVAAGEIAGAISEGIVGLLRDYTGRGPVRARTTIDHDHVLVVLRDTLTRGEQSLVADGERTLVLESRRAYQRTMRERAIGLVEEQTGRKVIAFLGDQHLDPDIAVEVFVLEPAAADE